MEEYYISEEQNTDNSEKKSPLVSAVVTTHDRTALVEKAINSVLRQTYKNIELIVVDDASQEENKDVLLSRSKELGFTYIYIPREESKGGNHARNVGIIAGKGKYIAFLDDDDEWFPEKIQKQVEYLEKNPEVGIVGCGKVYEYNLRERVEQKAVYLIEGNLKEKVFERIPYVTSCLMINKKTLVESGLFDEALKYWQEYELLIRLCQITDVGVVKKNLVLYRVISSDKNRLTNHLVGWEEAVSYIENKHKALIDALPEKTRNKYYAFMAKDGARRADAVADTKRKRIYLKKLFTIAPTPINFVKMVLNVPSLKDMMR